MDAFGCRCRRVRGPYPEQGVALLATLITVIVLAVMVVIMFNTLGGTPSGTPFTIPGVTTIPGATTTTAPATTESGAQQAAVAACQLDYQTIETALADYRSLNGTFPAAGDAWATAAASGGPFLQVWPESALYYSITWNGAVLSVIPVSGTSSLGSDGSSSSKSGCFAA